MRRYIDTGRAGDGRSYHEDVAAIDLDYRYSSPSAVRSGPGSVEVSLSTSGGVTEAGPVLHPHFFSGFLAEPLQAAFGMLACAAIARSRYYTPPNVLAILRDPVVTSNEDRLRFESFSGCCGVHARLDLLPAALESRPATSGTTNVDFNDRMIAALAAACVGGPMLMHVGADEVAVTTESASAVERRVPLPERWLRGFGEVQALARRMEVVAELDGREARRFLAGLPSSSRRPLWAVPSGRTLAVVPIATDAAACIAGPQRLKELRPMLRFVRGMRVLGPPVQPKTPSAPSAWELDLGTARFTITLSAEHYRGFSGEGAILESLASDDADADADLVSVLLAWNPRIDTGRIAAETGLPPARVAIALDVLAASGRVGYDLAEQAYFHRELPFDAAALETMHPRLADARALALKDVLVDETGASVRSGDVVHRVTFGTPHDRCTCPWWGKHQGSRGPCKHVLAARIARR
jgi:hypothetical protein